MNRVITRNDRQNAQPSAHGAAGSPVIPVVAGPAGAAGPARAGGRERAVAVAVTLTLALAAAGWVAAARLMGGMDMGPATRLGSLAFFLLAWVVMMTAMMLPGATAAVAARARAGGPRGAALFAGSYLAVWAVAGVVLYAAYRPHGTVAAGVVAITAGAYELTPVKRRLRGSCRAGGRSGVRYGLCCVGSTAGLMAVLAAVGVMSLPWMAVITVVVLAQKLLPAMARADVPLAAVIIALGITILLAPAAVPGLTPPM